MHRTLISCLVVHTSPGYIWCTTGHLFTALDIMTRHPKKTRIRWSLLVWISHHHFSSCRPKDINIKKEKDAGESCWTEARKEWDESSFQKSGGCLRRHGVASKLSCYLFLSAPSHPPTNPPTQLLIVSWHHVHSLFLTLSCIASFISQVDATPELKTSTA